jgi:phage shock protein PspC (stress-responsive transcriptional regulator)
MAAMADRLYRSRDDRVISGVAGGLAEQMDVDPSIIRVVWVILAFLSGGILAFVYLVMMIVVPEAPFDHRRARRPDDVDPWTTPAATGVRPAAPVSDVAAAEGDDTARFGTLDSPATGTTRPEPSGPDTWTAPDGHRVARADWDEPPRRERGGGDRSGGLILGLILILIGAYFLLRQFVPQIDLGLVWPVLVVIVGVVLVLGAIRPGRRD